MMKRSALLVAGFLAVAAFFVALEAPRLKRIEKRGPATLSPVAITLPESPATVATATRKVFNNWTDLAATRGSARFENKFPFGTKWSRFFLFERADSLHRLFPQDEQILLDRGVDHFIPRYVAIAPDLRRDDLFLYEPTGDYYWNSEYWYEGAPARFRCSFIIHVEPASAGTRVEIFEYQPTIWVGERFGFSAHAVLPVSFHDIRPAEPTTADRGEVVKLIEAAVQPPT
ncbi:MAG TPA: hypothetical protein VK132_08005 [Gemmatimonadales bacterium]|nr:hypothetical protein [Gemmatimonadales bacterium]